MSSTKQGVTFVITTDSPYLVFGCGPLFKPFLGANTKAESATRQQRQTDPEQGSGQCRNQRFDGTSVSIKFRDQHPASSRERRRTAWEA
ncbi:MAG TPA: hypothetical protein VEI52_04005 [Terriglobales bacterium]|nr:hypothetical protein [Terriglobales bacterium]